MKRREFITLLGGAAVAWPLVARAQQPAMPVVGFLGTASAGPFAHLLAGFRRGLQETGFVEGPIVFNPGTDPVRLGLVASLARPGGNATGVNIFTTELAEKRLGLLRDLVPGVTTVAVLLNPNFATAVANVRESEGAARAIGKEVVIFNASSDAEIETAFANIVQAQSGALLVGADPFFNSRRGLIVALAARHAIPAIYEWREFAEAGGLISYGTSLVEAYRQQGISAGRILKGEKPADLPVVQLSKFELVINLNTAKALGLAIPPTVLAFADEVIE